MTKEEKYDKLRDAGMIDMTLLFGCEIIHIGELWFVTHVFQDGFVRIQRVYNEENSVGLPTDEVHIDVIKEIEGHPLTLGRVLRRIENSIEGGIGMRYDWYMPTEPVGKLIIDAGKVDEKETNLWKQKDKTLQEQENEDEILDYLVSILSLRVL